MLYLLYLHNSGEMDLIQKPASRVNQKFQNDLLAEGATEEWLSIYLHGKKLGYLHNKRDKLSKGFRITQTAKLDLTIFKTRQKIRINAFCILSDKFHLKSFSFYLKANETDFQILGVVKELKILLTIKTGGEVSRRQILLKRKPFFDVGFKAFLASLKPAAGTKFRTSIFDPLLMKNREIIYQIIGNEPIKVGGKLYKALHFSQKIEGMEGMTLHGWIDKTGRTIKEDSPIGFMLMRESPEKIFASPSAGEEDLDLAHITAIKPDKPIPPPESLIKLVIKLKNIDSRVFNFVDPDPFSRQSKCGNQLTIEQDTRWASNYLSQISPKLPKSEQQRYLADE